MAIDEKFAKPHSAYVVMMKLRGSRLLPTPGDPSLAKATNSLSTMRVPNRLPTVRLSFHETPIAHAIGRKIQPRTTSMLAGNHETYLCTYSNDPLTSHTSATNAINIAATFSERCSPSIAPRPAASMTLTSCFGTTTSTSPPVFG